MGAIDRIKRDFETDLQQARWAGFFAQAKVSEHARIIKKLLAEKPASNTMSGAAIASAMRAWAARSN